MTVTIEVVLSNLTESGYGIDGSLTREEWQATCREKLLSGYQKFNAWQQDLSTRQMNYNYPPRNFDFTINTNDSNQNATFGWSGAKASFVVDLTNQVFEDELFLDNYRFLTGVLFCGVKFKKISSFANTTFDNDAYFVATEFVTAPFPSAVFNKGAFFDYATFTHTFFSYTKFHRTASFKHASFITSAFFQASEFNFANFESAYFGGDADFSGNTYNNNHSVQKLGGISFTGSTFTGRADFSNRIFEGFANWSFTQFLMVPLFHNSELHQDTTFEGAKFPNPNGIDETDVRAYNTLRLAMSKNQHLIAEKMFSRYVLDAESAVAPNNERYFYSIYKLVSNYGFSTIRPVVAIFVIMIISAFTYALIESRDELCMIFMNTGCEIEFQLLFKSFQFSFLQSLPLGITTTSEQIKELYFPYSKDEFLFTFVIIMQKIFSFIGWFLIGLAIRNLFKIK